MACCFTWVSGDPLRSLKVNFQGPGLGRNPKSPSTQGFSPFWTGPAEALTHGAWETQEPNHRQIRILASRTAPESDHEKAMFHWLLSLKNFRGRSRGSITPFLEAASGFEPEYGALQAPA